MTTIAYRDGIVAADGRVSIGSHIVTDKAQKVFRLANGGVMAFAGSFDSRPILEMFDRAKSIRALPTPLQIAAEHIDFRAILAWPDGSVWVCESAPTYVDEDGETHKDVWTAMVYQVNDPYVAIGSGGRYAKAAMDMGASAERAVRIGAKNDAVSGGKILAMAVEQRRRRRCNT